ncbi:MAG: PAS domain S-box protein [Desulfobulbaceae bacterium]|jgi:diguanylate cyclase (GGDEF)-like protein/PAS domain S-box-containing protein|nr:PAS domain S-box protein [Desulfobulbaceae bacterium]
MTFKTNSSRSKFVNTPKGKELLEKAEQYLDGRLDSTDDQIEDDIRSLIQKLRVYQIELEIQNEELQQIQRLLEESKSRYVQLFQHCPIGLAIISENGVLEKVNETLATMLEKSAQELTGLPLHELLTKDSQDLFLGRFRAFFKNPQQKSLECICLPVHHKNRILQMRGARLQAPLIINNISHKEYALVVTFQDITAEHELQKEISNSRNELNQIFESAVPLQVIGLDHRILNVNQAFCQLLNKNKEDFIGEFCHEIWHSPTCMTDQCMLQRVLNNEPFNETDDPYCEQEKDLQVGNEIRRYLIKTTVKRDQEGRPQGLIKAILDITERARTEQALTFSEERYRSIIENSSDLILTFSLDGTILFANQALQETLGYQTDQIINLDFQDICHPDYLAHCQKTFQEILSNTSKQNKIETIFRTARGKEIEVEGTVSIQLNEEEQTPTVRGIFRDISLRKSLENQLRIISITDELTGLLNRRGFMEKAAAAIENAEANQHELTLLYVDLDGMKQINDTLGHKVGDQALKDMAIVLRTVFRQGDLICRIGGDEFVILFTPSQGVPVVVLLAKRLDEHAFRVCQANKRPYTLAMSIGSDTYHPGSKTSLEQMLSKADSAMYAIKEQRKCRRVED